jgi:glyoxylase-like metal-dependent hydrolase (beta-lactamase superfamily II)
MVTSDTLGIQLIPAGYLQTNCYIVWDKGSGDAIIIDPGGNSDDIIGFITDNKLKPSAIVNTHGHADHIGANLILHNEYGCPILIHEADAYYLTDPDANLSGLIGIMEPLSPAANTLLVEGDAVVVGNTIFKVIHTPGHTPGGICLLHDQTLFSGDTLFAGSVGRSDFPGGSHEQLIDSIKRKLLILPDSTVVYSGHGPVTTIGEERINNPWLQ